MLLRLHHGRRPPNFWHFQRLFLPLLSSSLNPLQDDVFLLDALNLIITEEQFNWLKGAWGLLRIFSDD
jgi:hypothetical protein